MNHRHIDKLEGALIRDNCDSVHTGQCHMQIGTFGAILGGSTNCQLTFCILRCADDGDT